MMYNGRPPVPVPAQVIFSSKSTNIEFAGTETVNVSVVPSCTNAVRVTLLAVAAVLTRAIPFHHEPAVKLVK
jgi:hypothetical protein